MSLTVQKRNLIPYETIKTVPYLNPGWEKRAKVALALSSLLFIFSLIAYQVFLFKGSEPLQGIGVMSSCITMALSLSVIGTILHLLKKTKTVKQIIQRQIKSSSAFRGFTNVAGPTSLILSYLPLRDIYRSKRTSRGFWHAAQTPALWRFFYPPSVVSLNKFSSISLCDAQLETLLQKCPKVTNLSIPTDAHVTTMSLIDGDIIVGLSCGTIFGWKSDNTPLKVNFDPNGVADFAFDFRSDHRGHPVTHLASQGDKILSFSNQAHIAVTYLKPQPDKLFVKKSHWPIRTTFALSYKDSLINYKDSLICVSEGGDVALRVGEKRILYRFSIDTDSPISALVAFDKGFITGHKNGSLLLFQEREDFTSFEPKQTFMGVPHNHAITLLSVHEGLLFSLSEDDICLENAQYSIKIWDIEKRSMIKQNLLNVKKPYLLCKPFLEKGLLFHFAFGDTNLKIRNIRVYNVLREGYLPTITHQYHFAYSLYFKNSTLYIGSSWQRGVWDPLLQKLDF